MLYKIFGKFRSLPQTLQSGGVVGGNLLKKTRVLHSLARHEARRNKTMLRYIRIILATPLYLTASLFLLLSLKVFPPDVREDAKKSFV